MLAADKMRRLRFVPRWGVIPHLKPQSVAEHSFHVAWIVVWLYDLLGLGEVPSSVLIEALMHDQDESITGDTPSPAKRGSYLDPDKAVLKVSDYLEAVLFLYEEHSFGNSSVTPIIKDIVSRGQEWLDLMGGKRDFTMIALQLWGECSTGRHPAMVYSNA